MFLSTFWTPRHKVPIKKTSNFFGAEFIWKKFRNFFTVNFIEKTILRFFPKKSFFCQKKQKGGHRGIRRMFPGKYDITVLTWAPQSVQKIWSLDSGFFSFRIFVIKGRKNSFWIQKAKKKKKGIFGKISQPHKFWNPKRGRNLPLKRKKKYWAWS